MRLCLWRNFRDSKGAPLLTFLGSKGWDTNNSTELEGLWQGLILAQGKGFFLLIIEGDSQIIINMASKTLQGSPSCEVSNRWRMAKRLELIECWLNSHRAITLKHICREGNKVADLLANMGVDCRVELHAGPITRYSRGTISERGTFMGTLYALIADKGRKLYNI